MQLNGNTVTEKMASEPPEPPPRNPDKINASLKHLVETKNTRSLDTTTTSTNINNNNNINRTFKPILSLDSGKINKSDFNNENGQKGSGSSDNDTKTNINGIIDTESTDNPGKQQQNQMKNDKSNANNVETNNATSAVSPSSLSLNKDHTENSSSSSSKGARDECVNSENCDNLVKNGVEDLESPQTTRIKLENERLTAEISRLKKMLENSPDGAVGGIEFSDSNSFDAHSTDDSSSKVEKLENELRISKELIQSLKAERKKLRADKTDLLAQVKQLCASLQEKEQELRNFIRNFEQRVRNSEVDSAKSSSDRERERWSLLKHARDETERSIALAAQLNARDLQLQRTQEQLQDARRQLSGCMSDQESLVSVAPLTPPSGHLGHNQNVTVGYSNISATPGDRGSCSADSGVRGSSDRESAAGDLNLSDGPCDNPCITVDSDSVSLVSSHHNMYQYGTPKERSPTLSPLNTGAYSRSVDSGVLSRSVEQLGSPVETEPPPVTRRLQTKTGNSLIGRAGRGGTWGSISRVFARTRNRNKNVIDTETNDFQWSPLTEEGYAEKLRLLREASAMPIERWRASQVLAWLEVALGMPQYSSRCAENVKSGKVLLELSDAELETGLGASHPMHRKKLRLAIEEQRRPEMVRYPTIGQLGHTWVATEWLPDIGLPQYSESFLHSLVDARMLDTLSKKELEKYLGVTRKFHQASIVHGIHVLRILKYDRQALALRRLQSENVDSDPIVWTNQRFIRWVRSIDLGEYAENLKDSGVHGGLVVLEPSFSGETMATALGIPPSKNIIRRHLATEFEALVLPARSTLGQGIRTGGGTVVPITGSAGLQSSDRRNTGSLRLAAWKGSQGSITKALRFNNHRPRSGSDKNSAYSSTSPTPSFSSTEGSIYVAVGSLNPGPSSSSAVFQRLPPPTTAPPPVPNREAGDRNIYRVSAPPMDTNVNTTLPRQNSQHRRVKSISDIEAISAGPA